MIIEKFLKTPILKNICERLLLVSLGCFFLDPDTPLLTNEYQLDDHFMLGTNIILEGKENDGRSKNSEIKEKENTDSNSKL